jgi:hypothetical protein
MFRYLRMMILAAVPTALIAITPASADAAHRRHHRYDGHNHHRYNNGRGYNDRSQRYYDGYQPYRYQSYTYRPYTYRPYARPYYGSPYGGYYHDHGRHEHYGVRTPWGSFHFYD